MKSIKDLKNNADLEKIKELEQLIKDIEDDQMDLNKISIESLQEVS